MLDDPIAALRNALRTSMPGMILSVTDVDAILALLPRHAQAILALAGDVHAEPGFYHDDGDRIGGRHDGAYIHTWDPRPCFVVVPRKGEGDD